MYKNLKHVKLGDMDFYNGDNMELLKQTPDKFYDIAIVDPPYGIGFGKFNRTNTDEYGKKVKADKYKNSDWDNETPSEEYFKELQRVSKNQIIWGGNYFLDVLGNSKGMICWYKHQPVSNFSDCEYAWCSFNKPARVFDFPYYGNIEGKTSASVKIHPTQKPIALYEWVLNNYAKPNDKILDTHLGSGSIALACHKLNFNLTAIELDEEYFNKSIERIENVTKFKTNNDLF